jgi:hypothetical protein
MLKSLRLHVEVTQFVAKSGAIPALSRNGKASFEDESGRLRCVDVISSRWRSDSYHSE